MNTNNTEKFNPYTRHTIWEAPQWRKLMIMVHYNHRAELRTSIAQQTVRGPSMSTHPGKVVNDGIATLASEKVFALQFLQARNANRFASARVLRSGHE
jgi:hypothetical protein